MRENGRGRGIMRCVRGNERETIGNVNESANANVIVFGHLPVFMVHHRLHHRLVGGTGHIISNNMKRGGVVAMIHGSMDLDLDLQVPLYLHRIRLGRREIVGIER